MNSRSLSAPIDATYGSEPDFDDVRDSALSFLVGEWGWDVDAWPDVYTRRERAAVRLAYEGATDGEIVAFLRLGWDRFDRDARAEAVCLAASVARDPGVDALTRLRANAVAVFAEEDTEPGCDVDDEIKTSRENAA